MLPPKHALANIITNPIFTDKKQRLIPPTRHGEEGKSEPVPKVFDERVMMMRTISVTDNCERYGFLHSNLALFGLFRGFTWRLG